MDHRPVAGGYPDVRDAVAGLVEEHQSLAFAFDGVP